LQTPVNKNVCKNIRNSYLIFEDNHDDHHHRHHHHHQLRLPNFKGISYPPKEAAQYRDAAKEVIRRWCRWMDQEVQLEEDRPRVRGKTF
jgi:hypothetical protein